MGSLSNRQSIFRPTSTRAAVAQQGLAQHITPRPVSGRFLAAHLGVGRPHAASVDVLHRHLPAPLSADVALFYELRAKALLLQQQLAAHDRRHGTTPKQAGSPLPFRTPEQQKRFRAEAQARERETQRLLAEANRSMKAWYLPEFLRAVPAPAHNDSAAGGPDCFKPATWWRSQNPTGSKKVGWALCCATVKAMVGYNSPERDRIQVVKEHGRALRIQPRAAVGFKKLDEYMALRQPVMTGVNHTFGLKWNEKTTDHFVAIVGTGVDAKGKYYRFFDVGAVDANRKNGVSPQNRLHYDASTGSYAGKSAVNGKTYTISQLRFKPGTF